MVLLLCSLTVYNEGHNQIQETSRFKNEEYRLISKHRPRTPSYVTIWQIPMEQSTMKGQECRSILIVLTAQALNLHRLVVQ